MKRSVVTTTDPADVFVQLYDHVPAVVFRRDALDAWFREPSFWRIADSVTDACVTDGVLDPDWISGLVAEGERSELAVLAGIDEALTVVSPWSPASHQGKLVWMWQRYIEHGRLNLTTDGALLPRRSYPARPMSGKEKNDYFRVVWVSGEIWPTDYVNRVLASDKDRWMAPDVPVRVAFVPVLGCYADMQIGLFDDGRGRMRYSVAPRPTVRERLRDILCALDGSGAQLAILPEGCLSDEIYKEWCRLLKDTQPGPRSPCQLKYLLLGSGPVGEPGNRAILVNRKGKELLRQDKLADFTLTDFQVVTWGIPDPPEKATRPGTNLFEDIPRDVTFFTLDGFLGRMAVLVCESLSRWPGGRHSEIVEPGPSHILAPVFSKPVRRDGWERIVSDQLANLVGSWVMVSNSLVTATELRTRGEEAGFSCLVAGPWGGSRSRYDLTLMFGSSADHLSVAEVKDRHVATKADDDRDEELAKPADDEATESPLPFVRSAFVSADCFPELTSRPPRSVPEQR